MDGDEIKQSPEPKEVKQKKGKVDGVAKWVGEKTKYLGKPYKSEEEKKAWEESYKEARLKAMKERGKKEGKISVIGEGKKKRGKKGTVSKVLGEVGAIGEGMESVWGVDMGGFEPPKFDFDFGPPKEKKKRKRKK